MRTGWPFIQKWGSVIKPSLTGGILSLVSISEDKSMDSVPLMKAVSTPPACIWSADDCYPARVLHWLQQQAGQAEVIPIVTEPEPDLEVV